MLVDIVKILNDARNKKYGVAAPTIWDERSIRASLAAATELKSPIILDFVKDYGLNEIFENRVAFELADSVEVPVAVQQDHGPTFEANIWAIHAGFQSITVERSELPYAQQIVEIKELVRIAHAANVAVESEVGHVTELGGSEETVMTDPEQAKKFVEETGVDLIAVAIGNVHGVYQEKPKFNFERIMKIRDMANVPMTIHGGSGIDLRDMTKLAESGITKFNMQTYLSKTAINTALKYIEDNRDNPDPWKRMLKYVAEAADEGWKEELKRYILALKSDGKA
ncbi:MAG: class II fructose-bisphosphate aldolase [Actinobacteria bacterium]|nr:class II fructose-bisphosphate aldolase [Actinomycetota bacterium]